MLAGYCWPQSVDPLEKVTLYCHSDDPRVHVEVIRQGADDRVVFAQSGVSIVAQPRPEDVSVSGCDWPGCIEFEVDPDWSSGFYLVRMSDEHDRRAEAYFVVRSTQPLDAMLVLATSTWTAYNDWGGPSFYTGGNTSSLVRPLPRGFLHKREPDRFRIARYQDWSPADVEAFNVARYSPWCMAAGWANWEFLFVRWAEAQGLRLGYATSSDLDGDADLLQGYPAYVSVGHDEYWSAGMRDNVEAFVEHGGNAAFFSGNTAFWQARFENDHTQLVCYKNAIEDDPQYHREHAPNLSTMWSDPLVGRPENTMTGVSFTRGGYAHMPNAPRGTGGYRVRQPGHWAFADLNLTVDDDLGVGGIVVAYECDGCELVETNDALLATGEDGTPAEFEVLATAPARLWETHEASDGLHESYVGELNWVAERIGGGDTPENRALFEQGHAVMGSFRKGRGQVFTTGCTDWAYGLTQPDVATVTKNVLQRFVQSND